MIVDIKEADAVFPESSAVDSALPPLEYFFESGNSCVVSPVMRRNREEPGMCRIVVTYSWRRSPTEADEEEMVAEVRRFTGPSVLGHRTTNFQEAGRVRDEFLNPAKRH